MNILITGANGQLGKCIQKLMKTNLNDNIILTDIEELDITDEDNIKDFLNEHTDIDFVVNCAAYTNVDMAEEQKDIALLVNSVAVEYLAKECFKRNINLIHISTDYIFADTHSSPIEIETKEKTPQSFYGKTKLIAEENIIASGCNYDIVRTSWLYSEFGHNFVKTILHLSKEKSDLNVVNDQTGSPTYALDLAKFIFCIMNQKQGKRIWHFSNRGVCSWYEFAQKIVEMSGNECAIHPVTSEQYPQKAKRPSYSVLNTDKAQALFPIPEWKESLRICIANLMSDKENV